MANSVDNRVVQMEFENSSFEKGIAESLKSLEALHKKLDSGISVKGLDELSSKVDGISFASTIDQIDQVEMKAHGLVSVLKETINELGGIGGALAKGLGASALGQMLMGGRQRATNVENAKFQLKGLGVAWDEVRDSINYAVLDTAYGADEAAKAAAQFVASGVKLGEEMSTSLRSISGVAAMTNSSYDEMAHIFTTVAGNGRLMTMQLNQFAMRGLNVAAVMAKQWGITEEEVREMVHQGVIDFRTFSDAMDQAFGEHAKAANETFGGALSNMKAALSRIGADFIEPWREMERQVFLGIKGMLNSIKAGLNEYVDVTEASSKMGIFGDDRIGKFRDEFAKGLFIDDHAQASIISNFTVFTTKLGERIQAAMDKITESGVLKDFVKAFTWALDGVFELASSFSTGMTDIFAALVMGFPTDFLKNLLDPIGNIAKSLSNFVYPLLERFVYILTPLTAGIQNLLNAGLSYIQPILFGIIEGLAGPASDLFNALENGMIDLEFITSRFARWTKGLGATDEEAASLKSTAKGLFEVLKGVGGSVLDVVGKAFVFLAQTAQQLWPIFEAIGNLVVAVLEPAFTLLGEAFGFIANAIGDVLNIDFGDGLFGMNADDIQGIANAINDVAGKIRTAFKGITLDNFADKLLEVTNGLVDLRGIVDFVKNAFQAIGDLDVFGHLSDGISGIMDLLGELASRLGGIPEQLSAAFKLPEGTRDSLLSQLGSLLGGDTSKSIGGIAEDLFGVKKAFADTGETSSRVESMAGSLDHLGNAMIGVADKGEEAGNRLTNGIFDVLSNALGSDGSISKTITDFIDNFTLGDAMIGVSAILTGFMGGTMFKFIKSLTDLAGAIKSPLESIAGFFNTLSGSVAKMANVFAMNAKADMFKTIAIGIALIAGSLFVLSLIPADKLVNVLILFGVAIAVVGAALIAIGKLFDKITTAFEAADPKKIASVAATLGAFSTVLLSIGASIMMLSLAIALLSILDPAKAAMAFAMIAAFIGEFIGLAAVLTKMKDVGTSVIQFAALITSIAIALAILTGVMVALAIIPFDAIILGFARLLVGLVTIVGVLAGISLIVKKFGVELIGAAAVIGAFAGAMLAMTAAIVVLSLIPWDRAVSGATALAIAMLGLGVAVGIISKLATGMKTTLIAAAAPIMAMSVAILAIAGALMLISTIPDTGAALVTLVIGIIAITAAISALMILANEFVLGAPVLLAASVALVGLSVSLLAMAGALKIISTIPDVGAPLVAFAIALLLVVAAATAFAVISPGLVLAGVAMLAIGAGFLLAGVGVLAFAGALATLATIGPATAAMISSSMQIMAEGVGNSMVIMAEKTAQAIVAFAQTLSQSSSTIADSTGKLGMAAAQGFGQAAPEFGSAGAKAIVALAQGIGENAGAMVSAGLLAIASFLEGVAQGLGGVIDAASKVAISFINGVGDSLRNNASMLGDAVTNVIATIFGLVENLIADGLESIFGPNPVADWIRQNAAEELAAAEEASDRVNEALGAKNDENVQNQKDMMGQMVTATEEGADDMSKAAEGAGDSVFEGLTGDLEEKLKNFNFEELMSGDIDVSALASQFGDGGTEIAESFTTNAEGGLDNLSTLFTGKTEEAVTEAENVDSGSSGRTVGSNFGAGIAAGMEVWIDPIAAKAAEMVTKAKEAANQAQDSQSPSKDMMKVGGWFGEGYYIGISNWIVPIARRSEEMVAQAKKPLIEFANNAANLMDMVDFDSNPVITPVIDMSEMESGAKSMESLFGQMQALQFMSLYRGLEPAYVGGYSSTEYNEYNLTLDWQAGQDANAALRDLNSAIRVRKMTGGKRRNV